MDTRFQQRKHPRLKQYDYSQPGAYFITICTENKRCLLSYIVEGASNAVKPTLTDHGKIAQEQLLLLEERYPFLKVAQYVIMPNHIHAILVLGDDGSGKPRPSLNDIICAYKSLTTRICKRAYPIDKLFQTSYYEHVIRGREDYLEIAAYIENNPMRWTLDKLYSCT